jgi:glucose-1-phosphate adenylyltransferase
MPKVIGYCNLHGARNLGPLTDSRPLASTSFLGRYALMDFTLSNFSNSNIDKVGILIENQPRSIMKHLGSTNVFNTNTKLGFEQIMYNDKQANNPLYNHDINNIKANDWVLLETKPDVVVIAPSDILYTLDFRPLIKEHLEKKEKITIVYTRIRDGKVHFLDGDQVSVNQGRVTNMNRNLGIKDEVDVSMDTFIISSEFFHTMLELGPRLSATFGLKEVIRYLLNQNGDTFAGYRYSGLVRSFYGLKLYYDFSMEFLNFDYRNKFFPEHWPIYTVSHNTPPTLYGPQAKVKNSMIANGAKINGTVINSIISRNVVIAEGALVENAIIFTDTHIGKDVKIKQAVIDKYVRIEKTKILAGKETPLYIKQGEKL